MNASDFVSKAHLLKEKRDGRNVINLEGFIGEGFFVQGITADAVGKILDDIGSKKDITVTINSGGGSVFEAVAIAQKLVKHQGDVQVEVEGIAASAAMTILLAAHKDKRSMASNAVLMIHESSVFAAGSKKEMRKAAEVLELIDDIAIGEMARSTGQTQKKIRSMMEATTWMSAEKAENLGFVSEILPSSQVEHHVTQENLREVESKDVFDAMVKDADDRAEIALKVAAQVFNMSDKRTFVNEPWDMKTIVTSGKGYSNINGIRWYAALGENWATDRLSEAMELSEFRDRIKNHKLEIKYDGQVYPLSNLEVQMLNKITELLGVQTGEEAVEAIETLQAQPTITTTNFSMKPSGNDEEMKKLRQSLDLVTAQNKTLIDDRENEKTRRIDDEITALVEGGYIKPAQTENYKSLYEMDHEAYLLMVKGLKEDEPRWKNLTDPPKGNTNAGEPVNSDKPADEQLTDIANKAMEADKTLTFPVAFENAKQANPELKKQYDSAQM